MLPIFCDQNSIAAKATADGYGLTLELAELTSDKLVQAIHKLIDEPQYREVAKRLQGLIKDQEATPLEKAIYWVEYVLRHKGAEHLKSPASGINWFKYYMCEVAAFLALIVVSMVVLYRWCRANIKELMKEKLL